MSDEQKNSDLANTIAKILSASPFKIEGQWFNKQIVSLDGYTFERCRFDQCKLYTSKGSFLIRHCVFDHCDFVYLDEAKRIVQLYNITATEAYRFWTHLTPTQNPDGTISII